MTTVKADVRSLYCSCCGEVKMAELRDGVLVVRDRRKGEHHYLFIPLDKVKIKP